MSRIRQFFSRKYCLFLGEVFLKEFSIGEFVWRSFRGNFLKNLFMYFGQMMVNLFRWNFVKKSWIVVREYLSKNIRFFQRDFFNLLDLFKGEGEVVYLFWLNLIKTSGSFRLSINCGSFWGQFYERIYLNNIGSL